MPELTPVFPTFPQNSETSRGDSPILTDSFRFQQYMRVLAAPPARTRADTGSNWKSDPGRLCGVWRGMRPDKPDVSRGYAESSAFVHKNVDPRASWYTTASAAGGTAVFLSFPLKRSLAANARRIINDDRRRRAASERPEPVFRCEPGSRHGNVRDAAQHWLGVVGGAVWNHDRGAVNLPVILRREQKIGEGRGPAQAMQN
ncbi:hypothetical protein B0H12DRAFT_1068841 [Mycena haematopus]|nr:hypothetical protein B0H12DRAFT_1068841 [Mycena haematopus]